MGNTGTCGRDRIARRAGERGWEKDAGRSGTVRHTHDSGIYRVEVWVNRSGAIEFGQLTAPDRASRLRLIDRVSRADKGKVEKAMAWLDDPASFDKALLDQEMSR